jgi:glucose uptake protein
MFFVESYKVAIAMCLVTMLCWGSWANTQKLASKEWRFQLFYWDYCIGVLVLTVLFALTLGSIGSTGRSFVEDLGQASGRSLGYAFVGGVVFNVANILLVAAIDIAGMAVAFPVGIGLALVIGVVTNYLNKREGDPVILFLGVALIAAAIIVNALAYRRIPSVGKTTTFKGIILSIVCGVLMGFFYPLVDTSMQKLEAIKTVSDSGLLTPYTALVFFGLGLFLSSFIFNVLVMRWPFKGEPVPLGDYFTKGNSRLHAVGILGGVIWGIGMSFNIMASGVASPAVAYGLGQGATMVAALWGVFIWREFKDAAPGTNRLLALMFLLFLVGLSLLVYAKLPGAAATTTAVLIWR